MSPAAGARLRHSLVSRLHEARERTDSILSVIRPEGYYDRPIPERHRIIFYLGHLEAFDWNLLSTRGLGLRSFDPGFDQLFAFGIDPVGGNLPSDQPKDWPRVEAVRGYNQRVRRDLDHAIEKSVRQSGPAAGEEASLETLLHVAIEHRLMHAETFAYMLHQLPSLRKAAPATSEVLASNPAVEAAMVDVPAGEAMLGLGRDAEEGFGWDNEFERNKVSVPAFSIDRYCVSNGDFVKFVEDDGYENSAVWTEDAWNWVKEKGIRHPALWVWAGHRWHQRTMFGEVPLPLEWPVYVSQAEASAYVRWAGKALPTEAEWHRAAYGAPDGGERSFPWGEEAPAAKRGNFDFQQWDPAPVNAHPAGASAFGVVGLVGNGWEWTSTVFSPFPGFKAFPFYPGYSANFFDGKHYVLKGGSALTAACMLRRSFRNWFQTQYPFVYAAFRCVAR
jgi:gamma-glutamyl hercynylcysteine S-oxide synthase